jgi:DNA-binding NarL/FixJ family response regulator
MTHGDVVRLGYRFLASVPMKRVSRLRRHRAKGSRVTDDGTQQPRYRVVVIEDDRDVRSLLEVMLELDPRFELAGVADDGDDGVELVQETAPDAVVLDLQLGRLDGTAAIPLLRACTPRPKIVVFSAFADPLTLLDVLSLGADSYLHKGTAWAELLPTLAELCAGDRLSSDST